MYSREGKQSDRNLPGNCGHRRLEQEEGLIHILKRLLWSGVGLGWV